MTTTTTTPLLRNVAVCIPLTVGCVALFDVSQATAAAASSLLVMVNLLAFRLLVPSMLARIAAEESAMIPMGLLLLKFVLFTGLLLALTQTFPPLGVVLGFVPMVLGTLVTGIELALRGPGTAHPSPDFNEASS